MATGTIENGDYTIEDENGDHVIKDPGGTVIMRWDDSLGEWQWEGTDHAGLAVLTLNDTTADPTANGEVQRNAGDIKVFSGGSVRNLSDVGDTIAVSDDGTEILANPDDINFTATNDASVSVADDTDNTVTVTIDAVDTRTDVSDGGGLVVAEVTDINFGSNVSVTDDGDGTVTVDATDTDTRTDVSDDTTLVVSDVSDINFGTDLTVTDDADGTVTVDSSAATAANEPDWVEDGNSPFTATAANSITCSLNSTYTYLMIFVDAVDQSGGSNNMTMQVNGDTTDYDYITFDGTFTSAASSWPVEAFSTGTDASISMTLGQTRDGVNIRLLAHEGTGGQMDSGRNINTAHPITQVSFDRGASTDYTVEVYGR